MGVTRSKQLLAGAAAAAMVATLNCPAWASGHSSFGAEYIFAAAAIPTGIGWIACVWAMFGRATISRALGGVAAWLGALFGTWWLILAADGEQSHEAAIVISVAPLVIHLVRLAVALMNRATGGRSRETLKKWWRLL